MRLFEAILDANHRALAGQPAGLHRDDFDDALPVAALSCIDPRLNHLFPDVLGIPEPDFIWLRNAGNIITGTMTSTTRSLSLACAIKDAKEIAIIGHTDCLVCKTDVLRLTNRFQALGIDRARLPDNIVEFFGLFASELQNVITATDFVRRSSIIGHKVPVHGLMVTTETGRLDWVVNGYETLPSGIEVQGGRELNAMSALGSHSVPDLGWPGESQSEQETLPAPVITPSEAKPPPLPGRVRWSKLPPDLPPPPKIRGKEFSPLNPDFYKAKKF